jgi:tungstate transport system ATP-binding protein
MSDPVVIRADSIQLRLGDRTVLNGISLDILQGRCLVIMGANGAGKSQLLRVLNGLVSPSEGIVLCQGRPLDRAARNRQAMVFQRPVLLRRSVVGNLKFALSGKGLARSDRQKRIAEALSIARLDNRADRPARTLSGGEQQRLAIARALITRPDVLLLDEPTASLDPASTRAVEDMIQAAKLAGITVVLVTHDAGQARRLADDIAFLQAGRLVASGRAGPLLGKDAPEPVRAWLDGRLLPDPKTE